MSCSLGRYVDEDDDALEDVGLVVDRIAMFKTYGLNVTDLSSSDWCQQQVAFDLDSGCKKVRSSSMCDDISNAMQ